MGAIGCFYVIATSSMAIRWQRAREQVTQLQLTLSFEQCVNHRREGGPERLCRQAATARPGRLLAGVRD